MAAGNLVRVWADPPVDMADMETMTSRFEEFFGRRWDDVMCDAAMSFNYHRGWKAFYAVSGLERIEGVSTSSLNLYENGAPLGVNYDRKPVLVEERPESGVRA